jgi:hypothetical protein
VGDREFWKPGFSNRLAAFKPRSSPFCPLDFSRIDGNIRSLRLTGERAEKLEH